MSTWGDIINDALLELSVNAIADPVEAEDQQYLIRKLDRIIDSWAARKAFAYASKFTQYTLTVGHQPHLIGPGLSAPDFAAPRPVRIESASLVLTDSTPNVDSPIQLRDAAWWANQRVKSLTSSVPTDLYYEPDSPSGALYLWPIPAYAYGLRLETWSVLTAVPLDANGNPDPTQPFVAPQGYENAISLTLAEECCDSYGRPMPPSLPGRASRARTVVFGNNIHSPRISSADYGAQGKTRGGFNWMTGQPS